VAADTQAAILKEEPAPLPRSVASDELAAIVMRCLEKSCETRFQSARDLSFALSRSFTIPAPGRAGLARHWTRGALRLGACGVAIALILAAVNRWPGRSSTQSRFTDARFTRLTDWPGTEGQGEVSPDGRFVAFLSDRDRPFDVWFGRIGTGEFRNLTADTAPVRPPGPVLKLLSFAGDGSSLWSGAAARSMLLPLAGGAPRPFLGLHSTGAAWSPDGARLAYFDNGSGDPLFVADGSGSDPRLVFVRSTQGLHTHNPVWSPDGEWIYFLHGPSAGATFAMDIWRVRPSGDDPEQLTHVAAPLNFLTWVDQRTLLFVMREDRGPTTTLWTFDIPSRQAYRLLAGVEEYRSLSASRDGHRLVATVARPSTTLSRVPLVSGRLAERRDVQRVQTGTEAHAPRFGRSSLFFLSRRGSGDGLWQWQDGHSTERWRGSDDPLAGPVAVAPDERSAAVLVRRGARARLAVVALDGSGLRTLSPSLTPDGTADWSPDGRWIVTSGSAAGATGLFKVPVADGVPVQLVSDGGTNPIWSPDGQLIAYLGPILTGGVSRILGVTPSGAAVSLPTVHARPGGLRFLKDGTGIVYQSAVLDFHLLDLASGTTRQLTNLGYSSPLMAGRVFDVSADGTAIVFDDLEEHSDLVLIDLP
jgi:Tol biopolymer transport system component